MAAACERSLHRFEIAGLPAAVERGRRHVARHDIAWRRLDGDDAFSRVKRRRLKPLRTIGESSPTARVWMEGQDRYLHAVSQDDV
jgi:hypothetical protein